MIRDYNSRRHVHIELSIYGTLTKKIGIEQLRTYKFLRVSLNQTRVDYVWRRTSIYGTGKKFVNLSEEKDLLNFSSIYKRRDQKDV